jgi:hypothetical protein
MAGLPGVDDFSSYGGEKADYEPVEDPTTDLSADHWNLVAANVAAMTPTATRAWVAFTGHATTPADPASNVHGAVWGDAALVKPTVTKGGTGIYNITWPTTITDALGVSHTVNLRRGWGSVAGNIAHPFVVTPLSVNSFRIRTFSTAFVADDCVGITFSVFAV